MARKILASTGLTSSLAAYLGTPIAMTVKLYMATGDNGLCWLRIFRGKTTVPYDYTQYACSTTKTKSWSNLLAHARLPAATSLNTYTSAVPQFDSWSTQTAYHASSFGEFWCNGDTASDTTAGTWPPYITNNSDVQYTGVNAINGAAETFRARCAELALWSSDLDAERDRTALVDGFSPLLVRPVGLQSYWPLGGAYGDQDRDRVGDLHLTPIGSPTWDEHPRTIYPCECLCC